MRDKESRNYTNDQVSRIIRRAFESRREDTLSHQDLIDIGQELGLGEDEIQKAVQEDLHLQRLEKKIQRKKVGFTNHLYSYIGVNTLLFVINLVTPGPWWFQWPLLGWGIGLFCHFRIIQSIAGKIRKENVVTV